MTISHGFKLRTLLCCLGLATCLPALADEDYVVREYTFSLTDIEEVELHGNVGSMRIVHIDGNEIRLVLEIESQRRGWLSHKRDVSDVELDSDVRGDRLVLRQTEDGTETEWTVQLPTVARTEIDMGVGEIDAELGETELDVDLGVGNVDISLPESGAGDIDVAVGVGGAKLRGADDVEYEKAFVSQEVHGRGKGTLDVRVDLGVGDASITLE